MSKFRQRYLFRQSESASDPSTLLNGDFDLGLFAPSWDSRCLSVTKATALQLGQSIIFRFTGRDPFGLRERHEAVLSEFLYAHSREVVFVDGDAVDLESIWKITWSKIKSFIYSSHKSIRALVDITTCPRYYSLGAIAGLFRYGVAKEVNVLYTEGEYALDAHPYPLEYPFGVGQWKAVAIPFLEGMPDPIKRKYFIVSVGFEGTRTGRVLAREDPDRISILFPDPGARPEYVDQTWKRNSEIVKEYQVPEKQIIKSAAGDAIMAWRELGRYAPERADIESTYYLCCGTKAHSLAFALRAICLHHPTVLYNLPEKHNFVKISPAGLYWRYRIQDLSVVPMSPDPSRTVNATHA